MITLGRSYLQIERYAYKNPDPNLARAAHGHFSNQTCSSE